MLTSPKITLAPKGKSIYSLNEGYTSTWNEAVKEFVNSKKFPKVCKFSYCLLVVQMSWLVVMICIIIIISCQSLVTMTAS